MSNNEVLIFTSAVHYSMFIIHYSFLLLPSVSGCFVFLFLFHFHYRPLGMGLNCIFSITLNATSKARNPSSVVITVGLSFRIESANDSSSIFIALLSSTFGLSKNMELESFADSIINDKPTAITAEEGYRALNVAYKVMEKMQMTVGSRQ